MRAANCAITNAINNCPIATSTHSQMPTGPAFLQDIVVGAEDADRHGNEGEGNGEDLERTEGSFQLLVIATLFGGSIPTRGNLLGLSHVNHLILAPFSGSHDKSTRRVAAHPGRQWGLG